MEEEFSLGTFYIFVLVSVWVDRVITVVNLKCFLLLGNCCMIIVIHHSVS